MISKVLQVVANGSDIKEDKLRPIESFVKEYQAQIAQFLTVICVRSPDFVVFFFERLKERTNFSWLDFFGPFKSCTISFSFFGHFPTLFY
jgi:hypothetical protein